MFGFVCEIIGAIVVGGYLLIFQRHQPFSVVLDTFNIGAPGAYWPAFLAAAVTGLFYLLRLRGLRRCGGGDAKPGPAIPRAMRMTIYVGMAAAAIRLPRADRGAAGHGRRDLAARSPTRSPTVLLARVRAGWVSRS